MLPKPISPFLFIAGFAYVLSALPAAHAFDSSKGQTKADADGGIAYYNVLPGCDGAVLSASDRAADDSFGYSVAMKDGTILMGAPSDDNQEGLNAGAIYAFNKVNGSWTQAQKFVPGAITAGDYLGCSVDFDGQFAVFGARYADPLGNESGSVWTAHKSGGLWVSDAAINAWDGATADQFGYAVAMGTDWVVVSAPYHSYNNVLAAGKVYAFRRFGNAWAFDDDFNLPMPHAFDDLGTSLAMIDNTFAAGATFAEVTGVNDCGAVLLGEATLVSENPFFATWDQSLVYASDRQPNDHFGTSVAFSGQYLYVGAPDVDVAGRANAGAVYVYAKNFFGYVEVTKITVPGLLSSAGDQFGKKIAVNGQNIMISDALGRVYSYWQPDPNVASAPEFRSRRSKPSDAGTAFAQSMALDGTDFVIGDFNHSFLPNAAEGAAYVIGVVADNCSDAPAISQGTYSGCTWTASNDGSAGCGASNDSPDVWYKLVGDASNAGPWMLTTKSDYDSALSVHLGCPGTAANQIACDDDSAGNLDARVHFTVQAGQTYLIRISGWLNDGGAYELAARKDTCPADIAPQPLGDGIVNTADLLMLINSWGPIAGPADIAPAPNGNLAVNTADLLMVINSWGACP